MNFAPQQQHTRLHQANAQTEHGGIINVILSHNNNYDVFYKLANAFMRSSLFCKNFNIMYVCNIVDMLVNLERSLFGKSLLLNGLINFLIANSDGNTLQHKMLANVLSVMLTKYY
ncbi:ORF-119 [Catopsilia pomona nucleopolyhedrovirus]|uniref:ORF-119 n=1 Tax=Catopsilia pomona nucleopolyhedrovirus TaxID=1850906 RepID=A0A172WZI1_9ABAC|nr:ORF-119 [Catopsilia pomona nucleopolyhedrovirus]ANF29767.1 ORF-119 [Catopsilia pomona nucleopolyhedrovirus]